MADPQPPVAPRKSRKVLWIVLGVLGFFVVCMIGLAAFGFYFVSRNLDMTQATATEATGSFEDVRARFTEAPLMSIDVDESVTLNRRPPSTPSSEQPTTMHIMAYDDDDGRIVRISVPFWLLRMGGENIQLGSERSGNLDFEKLHISAEELERYGPTLLLDHTDGRNRVLVWTQ